MIPGRSTQHGIHCYLTSCCDIRLPRLRYRPRYIPQLLAYHEAANIPCSGTWTESLFGLASSKQCDKSLSPAQRLPNAPLATSTNTSARTNSPNTNQNSHIDSSQKLQAFPKHTHTHTNTHTRAQTHSNDYLSAKLKTQN